MPLLQAFDEFELSGTPLDNYRRFLEAYHRNLNSTLRAQKSWVFETKATINEPIFSCF